MLLRILSKPAIQRSLIEQSLWKIKEKNAWGRLLFSKDSSSLSRACNFLLNKVFTILTLGDYFDYNHGHNILRISDVLPNFRLTASETKPE